MKKLIPLFLVLVLAFACKDDECSDEFCPVGYTCVDGVCESSSSDCPIGYEGEDCTTESNAKFAGDYDVDYTGTGGLSASTGTTEAEVVLVSGAPNKIRVDVDLDLVADVLGNAIDLPFTISVVGDVEGDTYNVPSTTVSTSVDLGLGFPIPIDIVFNVEGEKISETELNTTLTMSGSLAGTIVMEGTK